MTDTRNLFEKPSKNSSVAEVDSAAAEGEYIVFDEDFQEIVGVGKSPREAIDSVDEDRTDGNLQVLPARADLAAEVRRGYDTCWEVDEEGYACAG